MSSYVIRRMPRDAEAHGPISHVRDRNADLKLTGWDREAHLTGVLTDSAGLITFGDLDYASMLLGNYVIQ